MSTTHVNQETVERRLTRLQDAYDSLPVVDGEERLPTDTFDELRGHAEDGYTGGGYAWIVRHPTDTPALSESMSSDARTDQPHVLLILSRDSDENRWGIPGGGRERGETYEAATIREVREETGLEVTLESPFLVYRCRSRPEDGRDICLHTLWVCFDATYERGHLAIQAGELRGAAWFETPPPQLGPWVQYRAVSWWDREPDEPWWEHGKPW